MKYTDEMEREAVAYGRRIRADEKQAAALIERQKEAIAFGVAQLEALDRLVGRLFELRGEGVSPQSLAEFATTTPEWPTVDALRAAPKIDLLADATPLYACALHEIHRRTVNAMESMDLLLGRTS